MFPKIALTALLLGAVGTAIGCWDFQEREITYENGSQFVLTVVSDGAELVTLKPGEARGLRQRKSFLPDHVQAYDEEGNLRFDEVITWEDLEASDFRVLIR